MKIKVILCSRNSFSFIAHSIRSCRSAPSTSGVFCKRTGPSLWTYYGSVQIVRSQHCHLALTGEIEQWIYGPTVLVNQQICNSAMMIFSQPASPNHWSMGCVKRKHEMRSNIILLWFKARSSDDQEFLFGGRQPTSMTTIFRYGPHMGIIQIPTGGGVYWPNRWGVRTTDPNLREDF